MSLPSDLISWNLSLGTVTTGVNEMGMGAVTSSFLSSFLTVTAPNPQYDEEI